MDLPSVVRVVSSDWRLVLCDPGELEGEWGSCDPNVQVIKVASWLPSCRLRETLLHELLHAVHYEMGLGEMSTEEDFTDRTARGLICLARDCPQLVGWLLMVNGGSAGPAA